LRPEPNEFVVRKHASDAFEGTDLHATLQKLGVRHIVVAGIQSQHCVAATCRGALRLGYGVRLAEDGHSTWSDAARSASAIIAAVNEALEHEGVALSSTKGLVESLRSSRGASFQEPAPRPL
jgi:nicotinamidase-related amidase